MSAKAQRLAKRLAKWKRRQNRKLDREMKQLACEVMEDHMLPDGGLVFRVRNSNGEQYQICDRCGQLVDTSDYIH